MKFNKLFYIVVHFIFCIIVFSCGSKKYIKEIPYQYSSDEFANAKNQEKVETSSGYSVVDDNPQGLNDDTLRIKEKYSIIMEVMPKEIRDYKLYSYLDEWIGKIVTSRIIPNPAKVDVVSASWSKSFHSANKSLRTS